METLRILVASIATFGGGLLTASAEPITHYVVFGDSLSDGGNTYDLTAGAVPESPPYWQGRYSNGPTWIEVRAGLFGLPAPTPSRLGGTNYAHGGAETGHGQSWTGTGASNMLEQGDEYLAAHAPTGSEQFVIWGGANDIFASILSGEMPDSAVSVANLSELITSLAQSGGTQFLVLNLPPLGEIPLFRQFGEDVTIPMNAVSAEFNALLSDKVQQLRSEQGLSISYIDVYALVTEVVNDPASFGFANVTDSAFNEASGTVVPNPDEYAFWDGVHPTARLHAMLASVPEPKAIVLLATAVVGVLPFAWRRR
ncbi:MAG: SGNH/GDSL hydrolase family protein [Pirellulales bacterium]|nr:SGNH/GDSL hydrolase family protein [Pirellulales bacterium]